MQERLPGGELHEQLIRLLALLGVTAAALIAAAGASAYYSAAGSGSGQATVPTVTPPGSVTVVQSGSTATITWGTAVVSSGPAVDGYEVTRSDGAVVCGNPTPVTTLSCTDGALVGAAVTYTVTAEFRSWTATATSSSFTALTAPALSSEPAVVTRLRTASFSFSGGGGTGYACQLDGGGFSACTSPASYTGLSDGTHVFAVHATSGGSSSSDTTYTWEVDTTAPTQTLTLGSGSIGAYLGGTTLYFRGSAAGSATLVDTVSDAGSGPASATFPAVTATRWTHSAQTVTTPSGGPYTSSAFSWTASPATPSAIAITGADAAGNTVSTSIGFATDTTAPAGGALTVNGTAASAAGSTSKVTNSTSFALGARTDYTDSGSGLASSVLTVQSASLSGTTCGAAGSGGPFTTATVITGTTQPSGIVAGYCYVYTLTGTDNVGNTASLKTTVEDDAVSFTVTTQPTTATAGTSTGSTSVVLTAVKNGATDTSYAGSTLTWSGASTSPSGATPTLPTAPTWSSGKATFAITLVTAETVTLHVSDGTRSATFSAITVKAGTVAHLAWAGATTTSSAGIPSTCLFTCNYASGFGTGKTWTAHVELTDTDGNPVTAGSTETVTMSLQALAKGSVSPTTLTIATGSSESAATVTYTSPGSGTFSDTLTATGRGAFSGTATAAFKT